MAHEEERFQAYVRNLRHQGAVYRWGAAEALGRLGDPRAVGYLIPLLQDTDWRVRVKSAWALGQLGDLRALPALNALARDESESVRDIAGESVRTLLLFAGDRNSDDE